MTLWFAFLFLVWLAFTVAGPVLTFGVLLIGVAYVVGGLYIDK